MESKKLSCSLKVNEFAALTTSESVSRYIGYKSNNVWSGLKHSRRSLCTERLPERVISVRCLSHVLHARIDRNVYVSDLVTDSFSVDRAHFVAWLKPLEVWF